MKIIKVGIIDDHSLLRKGVVNLLETTEDIRCIFDYANGDIAIETLVSGIIPDIIITDVNMPIKNGFMVTKNILSRFPKIKVIALSMFSDELTIIEMIKAGAKGYITKGSDPSVLLEAIRVVFDGNSYFPSDVSTIISNKICKENDTLSSIVNTLSSQEKLFLKLLCEELTYNEIGEKMFLSTRTIDDYKIKLCKKLKVKGRTGLVIFAVLNKHFL
ncbi:response regulator transcription factor [Sediminibacterium sp.]|uniref:response regulator transcription factor n=1 Tax=Sediminibacterium sp. TaxID=1917865 RepID=UPI0025DF8282|nr:response regulator transcription factor [Sediminibacterium sp.]MDO8995648.1 response regulator transcription factor [Sediminibacterium sp.]MDO9156284.1 response regulator transcription factor [Sediminibacterium sp.]MDP2419840.1 response regulator transcription factor [Sediminibacterium sp.]